MLCQIGETVRVIEVEASIDVVYFESMLYIFS